MGDHLGRAEMGDIFHGLVYIEACVVTLVMGVRSSQSLLFSFLLFFVFHRFVLFRVL